MSTLLPLLLLVILLVVRLPVGFALILSSAVGILMNSSFDAMMGVLRTAPYRGTSSYVLVTIPMFILMAHFATQSGITNNIFSSLNKWLGRLPGGVALATVFASAGLGAISGSSAASAATMGRVAVPEMKRLGYDTKFALGAVAASGTLAIMVPPSNGLILYAIITQTSVGAMLIAGIIPGILSALLYALLVIYWASTHKDMAPPSETYTWAERFRSLSSFWPLPVLIGLVLGGIYTGAVTVIEASAIGAFSTFIIMILMGRMQWQPFLNAIRRTAYTTTMIFTIIFGAHMFGNFLAMTQVPQRLITAAVDADVSRWLFLLAGLAVVLVLGFFMDQVAILVLTLPILFPLVMEFGFHAVWFGIIFTKVAEIGLITPPLGLNVFVTAGAANESVTTAFRGVWRFLIVDVFTLGLLLSLPILSLWLVERGAV
jgi:C4-dicarboxylate transporter, DctM subunit